MYTGRYDPEEVAQVLIATGGIKTEAARRLGCSWQTVRSYEVKHPVVVSAIAQAREELIYAAER